MISLVSHCYLVQKHTKFERLNGSVSLLFSIVLHFMSTVNLGVFLSAVICPDNFECIINGNREYALENGIIYGGKGSNAILTIYGNNLNILRRGRIYCGDYSTCNLNGNVEFGLGDIISYLHCPINSICNLFANREYSFIGMNIYATASNSLNIFASDTIDTSSSFSDGYIYLSDEKQLNMNYGYSSTTTYGKNLIIEYSENFEIKCIGSSACENIDLNCAANKNCQINCDGIKSCSGSNIY